MPVSVCLSVSLNSSIGLSNVTLPSIWLAFTVQQREMLFLTSRGGEIMMAEVMQLVNCYSQKVQSHISPCASSLILICFLPRRSSLATIVIYHARSLILKGDAILSTVLACW